MNRTVKILKEAQHGADIVAGDIIRF